MKVTRLKYNAKLNASFTGKSGSEECPKCGSELNSPEAPVEYKILTQKMLCGNSNFDKEAGRVEGILNALALEGWRVVGCMTQFVNICSFSAFDPSVVIVLERPVKR